GALGPIGAPILAASARPWTMRELLRALRADPDARVSFVPVPWRAVWLALKTAETLGIAVPFRSDSVISLVRQDPRPGFSVSKRIGLKFRDFKGGSSLIAQSGAA